MPLRTSTNTDTRTEDAAKCPSSGLRVTMVQSTVRLRRNARFSAARFDFDANHVRKNKKTAFKNPICAPFGYRENHQCYSRRTWISNGQSPAIQARMEFSVGTGSDEDTAVIPIARMRQCTPRTSSPTTSKRGPVTSFPTRCGNEPETRSQSI